MATESQWSTVQAMCAAWLCRRWSVICQLQCLLLSGSCFTVTRITLAVHPMSFEVVTCSLHSAMLSAVYIVIYWLTSQAPSQHFTQLLEIVAARLSYVTTLTSMSVTPAAMTDSTLTSYWHLLIWSRLSAPLSAGFDLIQPVSSPVSRFDLVQHVSSPVSWLWPGPACQLPCQLALTWSRLSAPLSAGFDLIQPVSSPVSWLWPGPACQLATLLSWSSLAVTASHQTALCSHQMLSQTTSSLSVGSSRASLRTALSGDLYVPRTRTRFGDRAFAVAAPRVWNSLPTDIKLHRSTTTSFKRHLKTVLFNRGFAEYM